MENGNFDIISCKLQSAKLLSSKQQQQLPQFPTINDLSGSGRNGEVAGRVEGTWYPLPPISPIA
jgi:hypothetical protein